LDDHQPVSRKKEETIENDIKSIYPIIENLSNLDLLNLTPIQALNLLYELQNQALNLKC